ncbi:MAG: aspartate ammonia-lyase [Alteromonadaceae bacterium]|nr:aspartate ammonia-lyase [Alteromonadaceae bacterium]
MMNTRTEHDSLGAVEVPEQALWGAQTQRAIDNFPVSGRPLPTRFIHAVVRLKRCAALANQSLGQLDQERAKAIVHGCDQLLSGAHEDQFPVDVYQTGSGTSTNMNVNEVLATLATRSSPEPVNPNDHINMSQSSNDVIPSAIHISGALAVTEDLLPAIRHLEATIGAREGELKDEVKTGRTHLMDAMPVTLGQELRTWREQLAAARHRIESTMPGLLAIPQGGTAVGTGVNAAPEFAGLITEELYNLTGLDFTTMDHKFVGQSGLDAPLALSGQLRGLAVVLMKIANDLRWMNSGPIHGLAEISLPALQPGSSIMPGKVNPVIPESVAMVATQLMALDTANGMAAQSGNFQLNVMLPLVASNLLEMLKLASRASVLLADSAIAGFEVNSDRLKAAVGRNPVLVTALNPVIGYANAAKIAKRAYQEGRAVIDVAEEDTDISRADLEKLMDPLHLTRGGVPGA